MRDAIVHFDGECVGSKRRASHRSKRPRTRRLGRTPPFPLSHRAIVLSSIPSSAASLRLETPRIRRRAATLDPTEPPVALGLGS